jgi:hypothetical protein
LRWTSYGCYLLTDKASPRSLVNGTCSKELWALVTAAGMARGAAKLAPLQTVRGEATCYYSDRIIRDVGVLLSEPL